MKYTCTPLELPWTPGQAPHGLLIKDSTHCQSRAQLQIANLGSVEPARAGRLLAPSDAATAPPL